MELVLQRCRRNIWKEIDADLDDIRYDLNHMIRNEREKRGSLNSVMEQLALTDYEEIRERLEHCIERLEKLPSEIEASVTQSSHLETKEKLIYRKTGRYRSFSWKVQTAERQILHCF